MLVRPHAIPDLAGLCSLNAPLRYDRGRTDCNGGISGPGEQKTAEILADWPLLVACRLWPQAQRSRRDDLDFIVVGDRAIFLLEEKHWGPRVVLGDQIWKVNGRERRNPLDSFGSSARLAVSARRGGRLRRCGSGNRLVTAAVVRVLMTPSPTATSGPDFPEDWNHSLRLDEAPRRLVTRTRPTVPAWAVQVEPLVAFLRGLPARDSKPKHIGPYEIVFDEIGPIETARCFHARYEGRNRGAALGAGVGRVTKVVIDRERLALRPSGRRDRTWKSIQALRTRRDSGGLSCRSPAREKPRDVGGAAILLATTDDCQDGGDGRGHRRLSWVGGGT